MKKSFLLLVVSILPLLFGSCRQEPIIPDPNCAENGCPVYEIPDDFKNWFMVPEKGATYIMQDSLTGRIERLQVIDRIDNYTPKWDWEGAYSMTEYQGDSIDAIQLEVGTTPTRTRLSMTSGGQISQMWNDREDNFFLPENLVSLYDSVEVLGVIYHQIIEIKADTPGGVLQRIWFAKDVGIIAIDYRGRFERSVFLLKSYQPE